MALKDGHVFVFFQNAAYDYKTVLTTQDVLSEFNLQASEVDADIGVFKVGNLEDSPTFVVSVPAEVAERMRGSNTSTVTDVMGADGHIIPPPQMRAAM